MQLFDNGCFFTVTCTARDVEYFAQTWPCFGSRQAITFQFDKVSGDLVDINPPGRTDDSDGGGLNALCDDAKEYGYAVLRRRAIKALRKDVSVTQHNGTVTCAAMIGGHRVAVKYIGSTKAQALAAFCLAHTSDW